MPQELGPGLLILGVVIFGAVVLTGMRVAKWRQPGGRWYRRHRRRPDDQTG